MFIESFILAAGSSKRAGKINKLTKKFIGKPLIEHTLNNYCNAKINRNNVITGYERDKIEKIANKFNIFSIYNKDFKIVKSIIDIETDKIITINHFDLY